MDVNAIFQEAVSIWTSGGWAMSVLAVNAFILFTIGLAIKIRLSEKQFRGMNDKTFIKWMEQPELRKGEIGEFIELVSNAHSFKQLDHLAEEFKKTEISPFERDLRLMRIGVTVSPLLGLLGTVSGMLTTFGALAQGSGGEKTINMVAGGISEALVTTETGLIIALPGLLFMHHIEQQYDKYKVILTHLETVCAQTLHRKFA